VPAARKKSWMNAGDELSAYSFQRSAKGFLCLLNNSMLPHRMNLKGPWKYEWLSFAQECDDETVRSGTAKMPRTWQSLFGSVSGRVRFSRVFHRPTNLDANECVFIVFDGVGGCATISVNGATLGSITPPSEKAAFDMTPLLQPTNRLVVEVEFKVSHDNEQPGGLWAPVGIEIRAADAD